INGHAKIDGSRRPGVKIPRGHYAIVVGDDSPPAPDICGAVILVHVGAEVGDGPGWGGAEIPQGDRVTISMGGYGPPSRVAQVDDVHVGADVSGTGWGDAKIPQVHRVDRLMDMEDNDRLALDMGVVLVHVGAEVGDGPGWGGVEVP